MSGILAAIDHLDAATVQFNELYARVSDEGAIGTYNNVVDRLEVGLENERLMYTGKTSVVADEPEWSEAEFKVRQLVDDYILIVRPLTVYGMEEDFETNRCVVSHGTFPGSCWGSRWTFGELD
jgi:hypothetical protein